MRRLVCIVGRVHAGEGVRAALMGACVFLILCAYYVMKTAREGLILTGGTFGLRGGELKAYANGAMALLLIGFVPLFGWLANRMRRIAVIDVSYGIVIGSLLVFYALARLHAPIGLAFFVWLGMTSVYLIALFWSYANDLYTEEQGNRLFAIIAIGGSVGGVIGPVIARLERTSTLLLVSSALVGGSLVLFHAIERCGEPCAVAREPITGAGGFGIVLRDRYLMLIAVLALVANLVNTTGEYILSNVATEHAAHLVPATAHADLAGAARIAAIAADRREVIKAFYSDFFFAVNVTGLVVQALLVSRVIRGIGVRGALFVLPLIAFGAYAAIAVIGGLAIARTAKVVENSTDYSLQNTVRQALFLPTDRATKYKAKAATDTFFVRGGDTMSALVIGLGIHQLGFGKRELAIMNLVLIVLWLVIAVGIARRHAAVTAAQDETPSTRRAD